MHQVSEFECFVFQYVHNVITGEYINVGVIMWELRHGETLPRVETHFRQDWSRVLQFHPDADVELLAGICTEISLLMQQSPERLTVRRKLETSFSNVLQISDSWITRTEEPAREITRLAAIYLGTGDTPAKRENLRLFPQIAAQSAPTSRSLPLWGTVAAGRPIEAFAVPETISLEDIVGSKTVFALRVRGDSMQDEHIADGDYVLVEKTKKARNGDIVIALIDGYETTLKRFYLQGATIRLQPSNVTMPPILVSADSVMIQGKVIGILRKY